MSDVTLNDYQRMVRESYIGNGDELSIVYPTMGFVGEAGEVANIVKKMMRESMTKEMWDFIYKRKLIEEMGDALYYFAVLASDIGVDISDIAEESIVKAKKKYVPIIGS